MYSEETISKIKDDIKSLTSTNKTKLQRKIEELKATERWENILRVFEQHPDQQFKREVNSLLVEYGFKYPQSDIDNRIKKRKKEHWEKAQSESDGYFDTLLQYRKYEKLSTDPSDIRDANSVALAIPLLETLYKQKDVSKQYDMFVKVTMETIRNIKCLHDVVGIQAMSSPVTYAYLLRMVEDTSYEVLDQGGGDVSFEIDGDVEFAESEKEVIPKFQLQIIADIIEAKTEEYKARFSPSAAQEINEFHGLDGTAALIEIIGQEVACEIVNRINDNIISNATLKRGYPSNLTGWIHAVGSEFIVTSKRGKCNILYVPADAVADLNLMNTKIVKMHAEKNAGAMLKYVGDYPGTDIKVFSGPLIQDYILGYKGNSSTDAGYIFSPYTLIQVSDSKVDPQTFVPYISLGSRTSHKINEVKDYYFKMLIENPNETE